ncbi:MAG: SGNH/GDSL hydrolase family protein [Gammaproteobacteria bacterium]|nr:SGNH/GDSL hydrolase family protein [Gammaproteobacteria bacterium]
MVKQTAKTLYRLVILAISLVFYSSAYGEFINYLDLKLENKTGYTLHNFSASIIKGNLDFFSINVVAQNELADLAGLSTNYLGQVSQDITFDVYDPGFQQVGKCILHIGIGSYFTLPDFSHSQCKLNDNSYLQVNPSYEITNNTYNIKYRIGETKHFSRVFVFGDSMSDNGNLYERSRQIAFVFPMSPILPLSPPYYNGRFTNGKVWVEQLAEKLNIPESAVIDFAYAGATIGKNILPIPTLDKQVSTYLNWNRTGDNYALYTVWIGANDLLRNLYPTDEKMLEAMTSKIEYNLRRLIAHGAKNILVPQLPDLAVTPDSLTKDTNNGHKDYTTRLYNLTKEYNSRLRDLLANLKQEFSDLTIMTFDVHSFSQRARDRAKDYGFTNITERCNPNEYWNDHQVVCKTPAQYVYWDGLHPSANAHAILADLILNVVLQSGFRPNLKSSKSFRSADMVTLRNKQAVEHLNKDIDIKDNKFQSSDFMRVIKEGIQLY